MKKTLQSLLLTIALGLANFSFGQFSYTPSATSVAWAANATPTTIHAAGVDEAISASLPIGFTFNYGCVNYTNFKASSNGWMTLNTAVTASNATNNLATSSDRPIIAPLWDDLQVGSGGTVNYKLTGTAPNRILTVEWSQMEWYWLASTWGIGFQVILYETTNVIEFKYNRNGNATANLSSPSASIGISGTTSGQFYSLQDVSAAPVVSTVTETTNLATKPATSQVYRWTPAPVCSGTPAAGTATSPGAVCSGVSFNIPLTGYTTGCGISYQWQSASAIGGPYSNIAGQTSTTFTGTQTATTYYRCVTTCSNGGGTNTSSIATVTMNAPATCYCIPAPTSVDGLGITNVTCGTINNTTGAEAGNYGDYSSQIATFTQDTLCTVNITYSTGYTYVTIIWVDWNDDGDFIDAGEQVYSGTSTATNPTTLVASFTVPLAAPVGNHRMRIGGTDTGPPTPCYTGSFGTFEDYTLNVTAASPMAYSSCTTTQANVTPVLVGSTDQEIIGIQIVTTGSTAPISATQFTVNATGSTSITDVNGATAKIYYTGSSSTFATTTLFGATTPTIANYTINGSQTLLNGTNYFWLVYDISAGATVGNVVDAQCTSINVGGARTPTVTNPVGSRPIIEQVIVGTGTTTNTYPFYPWYGYTRSASLYTSAEVGIPTVLTQLAWKVSTSAATVIPVKIYLKTTTATDLTADTWANMIAGATLVYNANVTFTPTGWKTLDITDFSYCGDNLLVLCEANYGGTGTSPYPYFYYTATSNQAHETWTADTSPPTGSGSTSTSRPNIRFDKAPAAVTIPNCVTYLTPSNGASGIICGANALLTWSPSITGCNPPSSYDVYFGTNPAPPFVINQTAITYNPGTLLPSTTYYWRIVPRNSAGAATCATVWSFTTGASYYESQTSPPVTEGFENCTDWTVVNGAEPNVWIYGTATANTGSKSIYIHNGGGTDNDYAVGSASVVHFYKDITFPAGISDYVLSFYWKGVGESIGTTAYDYLLVSLAPTTVNPIAGTTINSTYQLTPYVYNNETTWQYFSTPLPIACNGNETKRLIFTWVNNGNTGTQPPAAVDDIQVIATPRQGTTCANPLNINLPYAAIGQTTQCLGDDYSNTAVPCAGNNYVLDEDKVYKALIGAAGCVNVTITNASSPSIGFQVYDACPDAGGTCVYNSTTGASGGVLSADINIPAPGFYYIMVDSWNVAGNYVDYDINISAPGGNTVADPCTGAIPLTLGISSTGDNTCTNALGEPAKPACWTTGNMNTIWYVVTIPASNDLIIQTTAGSLLKTQIDFYRGNSCGGLTYIDCNQDASSCGTSYDHSQFYLENIGSGTYLYIRVDGENNLVGTFSIIAIDGNNVAAPGPPLPPIVGQDCGPVLTHTFPVCGQNNYVPNPGNFAYGNICDFTGSGICLASGEKSSTWYTININANGTLAFDIIPNDWPGAPSTVATDYDWALWKWETACDGTGDGAFCCTEISAGTTAATRCNYNSLGVTGMYTGGNAPAAYPGFDAAYETDLAVTNGEVYVLVLSNFKNDYTSGYSLNFSAGSPIAYSTPGATMTWSSSTSNTWTSAGNWGGCGPPNCGINGVIAAGGAQPVVNSNVTVKDLTINAGATLTINAGVTLTVCGNLTNNGTLIAAPTSTILFDNASVTHTISGNLTGTNKLGNLTINKTGGSVVLTCNLDIGGNFTTQNTTSILNVANYYLKVGGNFSTAANTTITNCPTIEFNGVIPQTYTNNSGTLTFPNVVMNNTGGGLILTGTTTSNLYVSTALTLTNGIIYTANPPLLVLNAGSTSTSGSALSFVDGPMDKIGNTAFVFPVGDAFNRWMRIGISAPTASTTFRAQYFYTPYASLTPMAVTPTPVLNNVSAIEYWQLDRVGGAANASVTLYWENAASSGINSCAALQGGDLVVGRWNGAAWENRSNTIVGGITGTCGTFGTVTSDVLTAFSPFTFSSKSPIVNPLPVELLSFTGKNNGKENVLEWVTATEVNNDFFTLERGMDGYTFEEIATVKGAGNSNSVKSYKSLDKEPLNGINYYRLKQTDVDGTVKYAPNVIALKNEKEIDYTLYPNPVNKELVIYADLMDQENINITITDISGRKVMEQKQFIIGGGNAVSINTSQFSEGIYFVLLNRENSTMISQKKFVKMK